MNDYCKSGAGASLAARSRSADFSGLLSSSPPRIPKYSNPPHAPPNREPPPPDADADAGHGRPSEEEEGAGEKFGAILSRNCSSASQRFPAARERSQAPAGTLQAAVRRAFSMRKPSSIAEGYRRIRDTADGDGDFGPDQVLPRRPQQLQDEARAPGKTKGKIIRACRRIFGL